ncbi:hypothetical protein L3Q82_012149 [Scortum barcoo]|uniref:Uncharacterized protein n=1 Tax=Scortum barcoo TaxID=214431 RepID=A0ACB8W6P1_9TELE|nr:hypothetical protein L3Q82_012149 [Scortum barcoo]
MKAAQQEVKHCVKEAKDSYRRKVDQKLKGKQQEGDQVRGQLRKLRHRKAPGPDKVCPRLLKTCAAELGEPLQRIFNLSRLFLSLLRPQVQHAQDRLQFAYQPGVGVEDAILYLLHRAHSHLDKGREEEYRRLVGDFAAWCHTNHLQLNTSKTKELVIDFGRSRPRPRPVLLEGAEVEAVDSYRYLGLWLDNKLDWTTHTSHLYGKTQSRMYFLRRLRSFNICSKLL